MKTMPSHLVRNILVILPIILANLFNSTISSAAELISLKESSLPDANGGGATRGISRGPGIKIVSPNPDSHVIAPFEFKVDFISRGGSAIDKNTVKVTYLKTPLVDLTERLEDAISEKGIRLKSAEVPPGTHQLKITVQDIEGRENNAFVNFLVDK